MAARESVYTVYVKATKKLSEAVHNTAEMVSVNQNANRNG
jgi:hypothetical protein